MPTRLTNFFLRTLREDPADAGTVIGISPEPNTLVARGSTVTLIVSSGPGQVTVPPLRGLTEGQALNQLTSVGLQGAVTYQELAPGDPNDGRVVSQSVPAGSAVDPGTSVDLVVGRATVAVTTTTTSTTTTTTTVPTATTPPPSAAP